MNNNARIPRIKGSFDFFSGAAGSGATDALDGKPPLWCNGALCACGNGCVAAGEGGGIVGGGGTLEEIGEPVGPVFRGKTAVGAEEEVAIVAPKSDSGLLAGFSLGGDADGVPRSADVPWIVALGSKSLSVVTNLPPSMVQYF
ncbi:MAG TPA: hypothetical protein VGJ66_11685 [Pyrinomonadaceae bacterium]|jgi:hypothetical protein